MCDCPLVNRAALLITSLIVNVLFNSSVVDPISSIEHITKGLVGLVHSVIGGQREANK